MRAPRFSIGSLLAMIAILGVGFAAMRSPSPVWASAIYTVAALAIVCAVANAIVGRGARRAYWLGFSLFGGAYFFLTLGSNHFVTEPILDLLYPQIAPESPDGTRPLLIVPPPPTLANVYASVDPYGNPKQPIPVSPVITSPPTVSFASNPPAESAWDHWTKPDRALGDYLLPADLSASYSSRSFRQIGHALAALLAAMLGGVFVRWRFDENSRESESSASGAKIPA
jgi:hypothetical protein